MTLDEDAASSVDEFVIDELGIHHLVAFHSALANLEGSTDHVEYHFLRTACFHSCAACDELWSCDDFHGIIGLLGDGRVGIVDDATGRDSFSLAMLQDGEHEGGSAAGRET